MKAASFLLAFAGLGLAVPAPTSNDAEPGAVQSRTSGTGYEEYSFELYTYEYCDVDAEVLPVEPALHVYAEFHHYHGRKHDWDFEKGSAKTFPLDKAGDTITIRYDYDTSEPFFEYEDCKWRGGDRKICAWCDQGVPWEGPAGANRLDCAKLLDLYRHRKIVCTLLRKTKPDALASVLPRGEDWKGRASHSLEVVRKPTVETLTALAALSEPSILLEAPARTVSDETPARDIPKNLYRISVSLSEYCENGDLKARGWVGNGQVSFQFPFSSTQQARINLHPGWDLIFGPYSFEQHAFVAAYDDCVWTSEGGYPCGWCEMKPWTLGPLNCQTGEPGLQRLTYRTCYFNDNRMNGQIAGRDAGAIAPTENDLPVVDRSTSPATEHVNLTLDVHSEPPVRMFKDNNHYYNFSISFSEFCKDGVLAARGWWSNGLEKFEITLESDFVHLLRLHSSKSGNADTLTIGPYNLESHYVNFQYGDCKFNTRYRGGCGWCEPAAWTTGPLKCVNDAPGPQRFTYANCLFRDHYNTPVIAGQALQAEPATPSVAVENTIIELASATVTPQAELAGSLQAPTPAVNMVAWTSTVVLMPAIIETAHPNPNHDPRQQPQKDIILPFHLQLVEYCDQAGERHASGTYRNGNMAQVLELKRGLKISINHRVPGYANLELGPFDYGASRLRYSYVRGNGELCEWFDDQTWKSCGECRAGLWSNGPLDCMDGRRIRVKDMDCSVLLGTKDLGAGSV